MHNPRQSDGIGPEKATVDSHKNYGWEWMEEKEDHTSTNTIAGVLEEEEDKDGDLLLCVAIQTGGAVVVVCEIFVLRGGF